MFASALFEEWFPPAPVDRHVAAEARHQKIAISRKLRRMAKSWRTKATTAPSKLVRQSLSWLQQPDTSLLGLVEIIPQDTGQPTIEHAVLGLATPWQLDNGQSASTQSARRALAFTRLTCAVNCLHAIMSTPAFCMRYLVNVQVINTTFVQILPLLVGEDIYREFVVEIHDQWIQRAAVRRRLGIWTSRQAGKTTAMAIIMAVALNCGYHTYQDMISCYSKSELQAMQLLRMTQTAFMAIPANMRRKITDCAAKHIAVAMDNGHKVMIRIHSSSIDSNRGDNSAWIVCDEFCFIKEDLYDSHLNSLERVDDRLVTYTTTPGQPSERLTALFLDWFRRPEAWPDRLTLNFGLVCPQCTLDNTPLDCRHRLHYLPPWTNAPKVWTRNHKKSQNMALIYIFVGYLAYARTYQRHRSQPTDNHGRVTGAANGTCSCDFYSGCADPVFSTTAIPGNKY
jgi:hypothetical protein